MTAPQRPEAALFEGAMATIAAGYLVRMVEIGWDSAKGKKKLVRNPGENWQAGPQLSQAQVMEAIRAGCNAYLYRLPDGVWVVDVDAHEMMLTIGERLGAPDVVTPRGGAHWLVDAQLDPVAGIDTEPRQLYGPGSFYEIPGRGMVAYTGTVPAGPRHLPDNLPRKTAKPAQPAAPGETGALADYLARRDLRAMPRGRANQRAAELLAAIANGPETGAAARLGINNAAAFLGGLLHTGLLEHGAAVDALESACELRWGTCSEADRQWIQEGLSFGVANPVEIYEPEERAAEQAAAVMHAPFDPASPFGSEPFTWAGATALDMADALLVRVAPALRVMWSDVTTGKPACLTRSTRGHWSYVADGFKWAALRLLDTMPRGVRPETKERSEWTEENWAHHRRDRFTRELTEVVGLAEARVRHPDHGLVVTPAQVEGPREVVWCAGTPWRLGSVIDVAPMPAGTPHMHSIPFAPADVPTPAWNRFVKAMWPEEDVAEWALRVLAVGFTGDSDAVMPVLHGPTGRGKSKFMGRVLALLGGYGTAASKALIVPTAGNVDVAKAHLQGVRLAWLDEAPGTGKASVEALKDITGGGDVYAAAKYRAPIVFKSTHTLVLTMNDAPEIHDEAVARRVRLIPCFGDPEELGHAFDELAPAWDREAPGVLAAMLQRAAAYLVDWRTIGEDHAPATVREITARIIGEQDVIGMWLAQCTRPSEEGMRSGDLYANFRDFARQFSEWEKRVPASNVWSARVDRAGYPVFKRPKNIPYRALALANGGDVSWAVAPSPVTGVRGVGDGVKPDPSPAETSGNAPNVTSVMTSQYTITGGVVESRGEGDNGKTELTTPPSSPAPALLSSALADQPDPGSVINCAWCAGPAELTKSIKFKVHKTPAGDRCDGSQQTPPGVLTLRERKAKERDAIKLGKITAAAGPTLTLPAAMRRGEEPRQVTAAEALAIGRAAIARNGGRIAVDCETNARPLWHPEYATQTIQLGDWAEAIDLDASDPEHRAVAATLIAEAAELEAFSYTADLVPLARLGIAEYDAMLAKCVDVATIVKLTDPALTANGDGLKETSAAVLGDAALSPAAEDARKALGDAAGWIWKLEHDTPDERNGWLQVDRRCATMARYAMADVLDCSALRLKLPQPDPAVMAREIVAERVVAKLPYLGLAIDGPAVRAQLSDREPRAAAKLTRIRELGVGNPDSPKQVTERLRALGAILPQTKGGNDSGAKDVLEKLQHAPGELGELAKTIMGWRDDATVLKNMIRPWARSTEHGDCRTYPTIYTLGADTGRMSCVRPNLQQVAREGGLRECIAADPGMLFIAADFSSVEVRVAAYVSGDRNLIAMINGAITCPTCQAGTTCVHHDLHAMIANQAYGPGFTKANRYNVKRVVFGRLYGGSAPTLAAQTGLDIPMVDRLVAILDALAPQLAAWSAQVRQAVKNGLREYRTYSGRVIHLDPRLPHKAPNYIIQGTARELLVDALIHWEQGPYARGVVLPVHDEIVAMVPTEQAPAATRFLVQCMTTQLGPVPITVEADEPAEVWQSAA